MTRLNVNPTRMELKRLKGRLSTATRGHKLLKDKSDEMIRRFSVIIRENKELRTRLEAELKDCLGQFAFARGTASRQEFDKAFSIPVASVKAEYGFKDVMGVTVPSIEVASTGGSGGFPYAFAEISSEADYSVRRISSLIAKHRTAGARMSSPMTSRRAMPMFMPPSVSEVTEPCRAHARARGGACDFERAGGNRA